MISVGVVIMPLARVCTAAPWLVCGVKPVTSSCSQMQPSSRAFHKPLQGTARIEIAITVAVDTTEDVVGTQAGTSSWIPAGDRTSISTPSCRCSA